jgi:hypothetical protein
MARQAIGISCNSRVIGLAVIENGALVTFQVKVFLEHWSDEKQRRIIQYLSQHLPSDPSQKLAIAVPPEQYASARVKALIGNIKRYCQQRGTPVTDYHQEAIHSLGSSTKAKKKVLMHKLVQRYPDLNYFYERELRNSQPYYVKLFEAVAAAMLLSREATESTSISS